MLAPSAGAAIVPGCVSGQACVHLTFPDSRHAAVDVAATEIIANEDIVNEDYPYLYASGNGGTDAITGISLRTLLADIGIDPDGVTYTQAVNPNNGYLSPLGANDLASTSPFADGLEPAFGVYGTDGTAQLEYIRPQRDSTDVNGPDRFLAGSADPVIDLQVYRSNARPLHPTVTVGKGPWQVGDRVTFSASFAPDDPPHDDVSFAWQFAVGDPSSSGGQSTRHKYLASGTYTVSVAVGGTGPDGESYDGQSPGVTFRVGTKPTSDPGGKKAGGGGSGAKNHPTTGPDKSKHGHHAGSAPTGGAAAGPTSDAPHGSPPSGDVGPSAGTGATDVAPTSPAPTAGATTSAAPTTTPGAGVGGAFVQGVLLDRPAAAVSGAPASDATRVAVSARRPARLDPSFDARWLWVLAPLLLLAAGALGERRRVPRRHGTQSRT